MDPLVFYGLDQEPFSNAPVNRFYYESEQTKNVLFRLEHIVQKMKGLAVVMGDTGAGKTTLARKLLHKLSDKEFEAALLVVIHSKTDSNWLIKRIAQQLGVQSQEEDKAKLFSLLYQRLVEISESGKKTVVLIDEAQMLKSQEMMEELRGILNLEHEEKKLITFVLFGLMELEHSLLMDKPLHNRVAYRGMLDPMNLEGTENYIEHRLKLAGAKQSIFSGQALKKIFEFSNGSPRVINTLCDNALFEGVLMGKKIIDEMVIQGVATDLGLCKTKELFIHASPEAEVLNPPTSHEFKSVEHSIMKMDDDFKSVIKEVPQESFAESIEEKSHVEFEISKIEFANPTQEVSNEKQFLREDDTDQEDVADILKQLDEK